MAAQRHRARALPRLIIAHLFSQVRKTAFADAAQQLFPHDEKLKTLVRIIDRSLVEKGAVTPYTTASDSGALAQTMISDVISILAPTVASAFIVDDSVKVPRVDGISGITVPNVAVSANGIGPVGEAQGIPVQQLAFDDSNLLVLFKNALILVASRDLFDKSIPAFSAIITAAVIENFAMWLDAAMFSSTAGSSVRSAGFLNGISALTKSVKSDSLAAMQEDVVNTAGAVSSVASGGPVVLVAGPKTSIKLQQFSDRIGPFPVYGSAAVAEGTLIAIAPKGIATSIDETPEVAISKQTTILMRDDPTATLSALGTPNTAAAPIRSLLQTDSVATRMIFGASWVRRSDSAVAYVSGVSAW